MNESKVKVLIGESLEEVREELIDFMEDKIVIDISYLFLPMEYQHKIILVYKETPEFLEVEDVELELMREIYMSFNEE